MINVNYIDINGHVDTFPKFKSINDVDCCEFILKSRLIYNHAGIYDYEYFEIPVIAFRKYAKKCAKAFDRGREIRIQGGLSWRYLTGDSVYSGFYICADKIIL